jgi:succinate dehydrogenase/fumarate reductase flavoprotein subunit
MGKKKAKSIKVGRGKKEASASLNWVHTLVVGSGAAGLNAAVQLYNQGIEDVVVLTEGLSMGTSINTGSDKQTYYKLSLCGEDADAPRIMAENYFAGGSMHGDLALVEASLSPRGFLNLVNMGVPFPLDAYGQAMGYKTDHDPRQRATSVGPYTSREMCRALIREAERRGIKIKEKRNVVSLLTVGTGRTKRAAGAVAVDGKGRFEVYGAENVVFAVGGPGGIYKTSVYPSVHTGAIGLALMAGAKAQSLPESQYGMASIKFRWNVSGTFMQVAPRFISTDADGNDEQEFLRPYFKSAGEMNSMVFLKGYQWPFDPRKVVGGSSLVDILVYIETVVKGRRVYLDYRTDPDDFEFKALSEEALSYLTNSKALVATPIKRLETMNPGAIQLYLDHNIDIRKEPLEIAVCAQHNNGGLATNHWWESANVKHLFPIGEVNGSHGVYRPGGSALNAGQAGSLRAADFIAHRYADWTIDKKQVKQAAEAALTEALDYLGVCGKSSTSWKTARVEFQTRMTEAGAHIRSLDGLKKAAAEARENWKRLGSEGCAYKGVGSMVEALRNRQLCFAHLVYLEAVRHQVASGVGSRGSALVLVPRGGTKAHAKLGPEWRFSKEDQKFRKQVLETTISGERISHRWVPVRPIPDTDLWFETAWAAYRKGEIYR